LLDYWSLPTQIVDAVTAPRDREQLAQREADESPLPQILHLATLIASIIVDSQHHLMPELLKSADRYRALTVDQIDKLLDQMQERVELMANVFAVGVELQQSYREIMARAHAQMSQIAEEALPDLMGVGDRHAGVAECQELSYAIDRFAQGLSPLAVPDRRQTMAPPPAAPGDFTWHDPGLCGRINAAIATCRARQREFSLVLLEIDEYIQLLVREGLMRAGQVVASVQQGIAVLCDVPFECLLIGDARYAVLLPDCDRRQAVAVARTLVDHLPEWLQDQENMNSPITASAGVAALSVPTRNFRPEDLIDAADHCLFAARSSGGGVVKSIDVLS
jgi:GGDEF domain-containing protein